GAGPAGSACALTLARKGVNVLLVEKARVPGERNMTGGVLYGEFEGGCGMTDLVPDFETDAPVQRRIVSHEVSVLSAPDWENGTYRYYRMTRRSLPARLGLFQFGLESGHDYAILRRDFDQWFAARAVREGAMLSTQTSVEGLVREGDAITGVTTTHEYIGAKLVIDASGVTSNLIEMAGLRPGGLRPPQLYQGVKHVYRMDPAVMEKRFRLKKGEGRAMLYLGEFMLGVHGGAFIYTNLDTLSVGVVVSMDSMVHAYTERFDRAGKTLDVLLAFEEHPMVAELLEGAEVVEYSAHNAPKGHRSMLETPYAPGFLATGDALGSFVKIGPLLDGMRSAIATGVMAAQTYIRAAGSPSGTRSAAALSWYREALGPIYRNVARSRRDNRVSESRFVYDYLPSLLFTTVLPSREGKIRVARSGPGGDAMKRTQRGTDMLDYDEDRAYAHIQVDLGRGSASGEKPWVPCCPVNCYTLVTPKGVFASTRDLLDHNVAPMQKLFAEANGFEATSTELRAMRDAAWETTRRDVAEGRLRFDHIACVECGTCGQIGPRETVSFGHERDGHGVRYRYG
ncbi:MAG: FAD-dependent oxidoreductase, partial [Nitrososphaerales archaeon]